MIDPHQITNFNRTDAELEEFSIFCCVVAGKKATTQAKALQQFLDMESEGKTPFEKIRYMWRHTNDDAVIKLNIYESRLGQYTRTLKAFKGLSSGAINLRTCTVDDLEKIHGIGPKTSRFFILHSRPNQQYAVLDRHILAWLGEQGYSVPNQTPQTKKKYQELEQAFIKEANKRNLSVAELDLQIWSERSTNDTK